MKLRNKILLPVIIILTVTVTTISAINYFITQNAVTDMLDTEMETAIENILSAEELSNEVIDLLMEELDGKNLALSRALAEIVRLNPDALAQKEMTRLAEMLNVTEVHVVDENGILLWGNIPGYYGFDFAGGGQTIPFLQILEDPSYELAQEPQPNATTGKMFQYTGVARTDEPGLVQVGISADIINALTDSLSIQRTLAGTRVGKTGFCFIVEDGTVSASFDETMIGASFTPVINGRTENGLWLDINGAEYYANSLEAGQKTVYAVMPRAEFYEHLVTLGISSAGISVAAVVVMAVIVILILMRVTRPMERLNQNLVEVAEGNLNVNIALNSKDEIGQISTSMSKVLAIFNRLIDNMSGMASKHNEQGEIDYFIDETELPGRFSEVASHVNAMVAGHIETNKLAMSVFSQMAEGDFDASMPQLPGKKVFINEAIEEMRQNIKSVAEETLGLIVRADRGDLSARAEAEKFNGGWKEILHNLNALVNTVANQANWYESILDSIPFPLSVTDRDMKWTFINKATESFLNKTRAEVAGQPCSNWGAGICKTDNCGIVCAKRGKNQTTFQQAGMDFQVDVASLKNLQGEDIGYVEVVQDISRLEETIRKINQIMQNTQTVSEQVSQGAKQISESSQQIASGASNQANAIQELSASIETINAQTQSTAEKAQRAGELSTHAHVNAEKGNDEMTRMVSSMDGIKAATASIAQIINTIESIAFQTNLLALNASVEAARAGEHGKGFSVVADEVRLLAGHSKKAAQETNALITNTTQKVEEGTEIALATARSFKEIVTDFENVSEIIRDIATASSQQAESIDQIGTGISQITEITQANSATSQEAAAASEELANQSEALSNMFESFTGK